MEWLVKISDAINFMEENIIGKLDYTKAASVACCSVSRFQIMFSFLTDITPAEYVRRRKMALSAEELLNSNVKVIDLSYKYGYESPEAFTRSFKSYHGISPSDVRKYGKYIEYPRISFQLRIQGGHFAMGTTSQFETYKEILIKMETIEQADTVKIAGVTSDGLPEFQNIGVFHEKYAPLLKGKHTPHTEFGISSNIPSEGFYTYGCQIDTLNDIPEGMVGIDTGLKKFACLTFRVQSGGDLVGGNDGPGNGMQLASEYLQAVWLRKNKDKVYGIQNDNNYPLGFYIEVKKKEANYELKNTRQGLENSYHLSWWIEAYRVCISENEMCFYIPLK